MKPADLDKLIVKYYEGDTSLEEESQLRQFFKQQSLPEKYSEAKAYFEAMDEMSAFTISDDFEGKLDEAIIAEEKPARLRITTYWISGVAATILLFLAIWLGPELVKPKELYGTINDPKIAFLETKKVLSEVSQKFNEGIKPAAETTDKVKENVEKAGELKKVNKALKKTEDLNKLDEASDLLKSFSKVTIIAGNS